MFHLLSFPSNFKLISLLFPFLMFFYFTDLNKLFLCCLFCFAFQLPLINNLKIVVCSLFASSSTCILTVILQPIFFCYCIKINSTLTIPHNDRTLRRFHSISLFIPFPNPSFFWTLWEHNSILFYTFFLREYVMPLLLVYLFNSDLQFTVILSSSP